MAGRAEYHHISANGEAKQHIGNVYYNSTTNYYASQGQHSDDAVKSRQRDEALLRAAVEGQIRRVRRLLQLGADVDHVEDRTGYCALHHAALGGCTEIVEALLTAGADVSARSEGNETALHIAALKGHNEICHLLLRYSADVHVRANAVGAPLHCAVFQGDVDVCKTLLKRGASLNDRAHLNYDHMRSVCPNAEDFAGCRTTFDCYALDVAIDRGDVKTVELLLDSGASTEFPCARWIPAVGLRRLSGWDVSPLGTHAVLNGVRPVLRACCLEDPTILKLLVDRGADMYRSDDHGMTALMYAAFSGREACLRELLQRMHSFGSTPSWANLETWNFTQRRCHDGFQALDLARSRSHNDCVELLHNHRAVMRGPKELSGRATNSSPTARVHNAT